jgi:hypothetical protein
MEHEYVHQHDHQRHHEKQNSSEEGAVGQGVGAGRACTILGRDRAMKRSQLEEVCAYFELRLPRNQVLQHGLVPTASSSRGGMSGTCTGKISRRDGWSAYL